MKNKSVRLAVVSVVAVLSVFGLSQTPASASDARNQPARGPLCCR